MKKIKTFESYEVDKLSYKVDKFWLIPTKMPYFEITLDKIVLSENIIDPKWKKYHLHCYHLYTKYQRIYISTKLYSWDSSKKSFSYEGQLYMGNVKITQKDIEEWELKTNIKNFNL